MTDNGQPPPESMTVAQATVALGYKSSPYVITLIHAGALKAERDGRGQWRVDAAAVRNFKRPPHYVNRAFADGAHPANTPINPKRKWATMQELVDKVRAGEVKPLYYNSAGQRTDDKGRLIEP